MCCKYCESTGIHDCACPNYEPPKASRYCSICHYGIYAEEEYIINPDEKYAHYDCVTDLPYREMVEWLGGEIMTMEKDYGEDY